MTRLDRIEALLNEKEAEADVAYLHPQRGVTVIAITGDLRLLIDAARLFTAAVRDCGTPDCGSKVCETRRALLADDEAQT